MRQTIVRLLNIRGMIRCMSWSDAQPLFSVCVCVCVSTCLINRCTERNGLMFLLVVFSLFEEKIQRKKNLVSLRPPGTANIVRQFPVNRRFEYGFG